MKRNYWVELPEKKRTYHFNANLQVVITEPKKIYVSDNNRHYIETGDGRKLIINKSWVYLEIDGDWIPGLQ